MADFCYSCAEEHLGIAGVNNDFKGLCADNEVLEVLCEGCGPIEVDSKGKRVED